MESNKLDNLIVTLGNQGAKPALSHPVIRFLKWMGLAIVATLAMTLVIGIRPDLTKQIHDWRFWFELITILFLILSTGIMSFWLSIPGHESKYKVHYLLLPLFVWIFVLALAYTGSPKKLPFWQQFIQEMGKGCFTFVLIAGPPLFLILFSMIKKAAPVLAKWIGIFIALCTFGLASLALHFHCHNSDPLHVLASHVLPVALMAIVGLWIGRKGLKW